MSRNRYECVACGQVFKFYAPAQRHAYESKHARIRISAPAGRGETQQP